LPLLTRDQNGQCCQTKTSQDGLSGRLPKQIGHLYAVAQGEIFEHLKFRQVAERDGALGDISKANGGKLLVLALFLQKTTHDFVLAQALFGLLQQPVPQGQG